MQNIEVLQALKEKKTTSPLQLGKIGEKIYKVFKFLSNTPWASRKRKPKSSPR